MELWQRTRIDWGYARGGVSQAVRKERQLKSSERRWVLESLYNMIRQVRRIDAALAGQTSRLAAGTQRALAQVLAYQLLEGEVDTLALHQELPAIDWQRVATVDARIAKERKPEQRLALSQSLPDWLAERIWHEYGEDAFALAKALNSRAPLTVRANTLATTRDALLARLAHDGIAARAGKLAPQAIIIEQRLDVASTAAYREGLLELQDEGSQLIAELVAPPQDGLVLDACAGAGGKTLALAAMMQSKGRLLATDTDAKKLEELKRRARRAGASSVLALSTPPFGWPTEIGREMGHLDRVLVDAPCSGIGSLRRNPEQRWRIEPDDVRRLAALQLDLLVRAAELLAPAGRLVYATCTLLREENEEVVHQLLARVPRLAVVPIGEVLPHDVAAAVSANGFMKTLPHLHGSDGFFAAVLQNRSS